MSIAFVGLTVYFLIINPKNFYLNRSMWGKVILGGFLLAYIGLLFLCYKNCWCFFNSKYDGVRSFDYSINRSFIKWKKNTKHEVFGGFAGWNW